MKWKTRIQRAIKKGKFTLEDKDMSGSFRTCAISEKVNKKTLESERHIASLLTFEAKKLGIEFDINVSNDMPSDAKQTYEKIQKLKSVEK